MYIISSHTGNFSFFIDQLRALKGQQEDCTINILVAKFLMLYMYIYPQYTHLPLRIIVNFSNDSELFKGSVDYEIKIPVLTVHVSIFSAR